MILIIIPTVISDISLMIIILVHVNQNVLVIGLMKKLLMNASINLLVLKRSIMILMLKNVYLGTLLMTAQDQDSGMVLCVNVKFLVLSGVKKITGVFVNLLMNY